MLLSLKPFLVDWATLASRDYELGFQEDRSAGHSMTTVTNLILYTRHVHYMCSVIIFDKVSYQSQIYHKCKPYACIILSPWTQS